MRILITGSNGFIGNYACNRLKHEHEIIGIGTKHLSTVPGIIYHKANIEDQSFVAEIKKKVEHCDIVIHLAAQMDKDNFNYKLIDVNCRGSLNVLLLAKELGAKKIIHSSGLTVIGKPVFLPITEEHPTSPSTLYHITKLTSEQIINLGSQHNINAVNLRIASPVGIGMNEGTILPVLLKRCLKNQPIIIHGNGLRKQNYIDVRDVAEAIFATIDNGIDGTFNIASETVISNIDLANLCIKTTKSYSEITFNGKEDPEESYCWNTSILSAKKTFSFEPQYSLVDTINDMLNYWSISTISL